MTSLAIEKPVAPAEWTESLAAIRPLSTDRPDGENDLALCVDPILDFVLESIREPATK